MSEFVAQGSEFLAFLQLNVDRARADVTAGRVHRHEDVMAEMGNPFADLEHTSQKDPA